MKITISGLTIDTQEKLERMRKFNLILEKILEVFYWKNVEILWDNNDFKNLKFNLRYKFDRLITKEHRDKLLKGFLKKGVKSIPIKK